MKSIFLSVVVISALAIAGIGGTFANVSDTEMVNDSAFTTGDMDLKVCDAPSLALVDDPPWGPGATSGVDVEWADPGKDYYLYQAYCVANMGSIDGTLYIHFKNFSGVNVEPSHANEHLCTTNPLRWKTEPELVEERGGTLDQIWVPGKGKYGDGATYPLPNYLYINVYYAGKWLFTNPKLMKNIECKWYELGPLLKCGATKDVGIYLRYDNILDPNWVANDGDKLFKYHFTNGLMADKGLWDVDFGLVSVDP